jgi:hypothetical protein
MCRIPIGEIPGTRGPFLENRDTSLDQIIPFMIGMVRNCTKQISDDAAIRFFSAVGGCGFSPMIHSDMLIIRRYSSPNT